MSKESILNSIGAMARTQGFYKRLYAELTNGTAEAEEKMMEMENQNFRNVIDMVMWCEGI